MLRPVRQRRDGFRHGEAQIGRRDRLLQMGACAVDQEFPRQRAQGIAGDEQEPVRQSRSQPFRPFPESAAVEIRHPQIGAPQLVARVTDAHVVNAGDGKHQHPTQALLDLYTLQQEVGSLEGLHVAIVGDVLHSRVARSLLQAFELVGTHTILVGPPALLPRDLPAKATTDIGAIRDADVVYVLRMQNERMQAGANFVPSLREYSARWGITPERLRPGQKVMHPGPMNRGVEIDGRVADSPDSLVTTEVRSGLVVRMAVLYDVLTGGPVGVRALAAAEVA